MKKPEALIVDDNPDDREILKRLLGKRLEVTAVSKGEECLLAAKEKEYDLTRRKERG